MTATVNAIVAGILCLAAVFVLFAARYLNHADPCLDLDNLSPDCRTGRAR